MAFPSHMNHSIHMTHQGIFDSRLQGEESAGSELVGEPHLILGLHYEVDVDGDITCTLVESRHSFSDCTSSFLNSYIKEKEPLPLDAVMNPQIAEMIRWAISREIARLVRRYVRAAGLKRLQVDVISKIYETQEGEDRMGEEGEEIGEEANIRGESRLPLVKKSVCVGDGTSACSSTSMADEEVCAVCLEEMAEGGKEVLCTPCSHLFHAQCIERWTAKCSSCPLCRFDIGS